MRAARKKVRGEDALYHVTSRFAGPIGEYPMTDADKSKGLEIVRDLTRLFVVDPICICFMGNHYHLILNVPGTPPTPATAAKRWNAFYGKKREHLDPGVQADRCEEVASQLVDLSQFMSQVNQRFTLYYNRVHQRRGPLWADRFKSTILEGRQALWNCAKYVELNPVRAGLVEDPATYRFSSWGWYKRRKEHFFGTAFCRYLRRSLGEAAAAWSDAEVAREFHSELARTMAAERKAAGEAVDPMAVKLAARRDEQMPLRFLRQTRLWTDGGVVGGRGFVEAMGRRFAEAAPVQPPPPRDDHAEDIGASLYCLKRQRKPSV